MRIWNGVPRSFANIAARLRRLAQQTRSPDPCRELMNLAERFERMAQSLAGGGPPEPEA
jgi:hypothetical protein